MVFDYSVILRHCFNCADDRGWEVVMDGEYQRIWKKMVLAYLEILFRNSCRN